MEEISIKVKQYADIPPGYKAVGLCVPGRQPHGKFWLSSRGMAEECGYSTNEDVGSGPGVRIMLEKSARMAKVFKATLVMPEDSETPTDHTYFVRSKGQSIGICIKWEEAGTVEVLA